MSLLTNVEVGTVTDGNGLTIKIYATEIEGGGFTLRVEVVSGFADLRGFFLDGATATGSSLGAPDTDLAKDVNMNGRGVTFDSAYEIGSAGIGKDDISSVTFTFGGSLADLDNLDFGIRATSVGATADSRGDSVKLVGQFDIPEPPPPPPVDHFPTFDKDISHITLYFDTDGAGDKNNDGVYTVKIDTPKEFDDDLDNSIDAIVAYIVANDDNVDSADQLLGVAIKGGNVDNADGSYDTYFAIDGNNSVTEETIFTPTQNPNDDPNNGTTTTYLESPDPVPTGELVQNNQIDATYDYADVFGTA